MALAEEEYSTGLAFIERAQQIYAKQPETVPLLVAALLDTQASIELAQKHIEQAISTYRRALDLHIQILGQKDFDLIDPLEHLAKAYLAQKEDWQAEKYLFQALSIYQEEQRPEDILLDSVLNSLAEIEIRRKHLDIARSYLDRSRAIREQALDNYDPRTIEMVQKIARITHTQVEL